jgi:glycosyltransferase involved in cell wall biosynthesis
MPTLAVVVITKNEEDNIVACLRGVSFADQLIVLDHGSTDATVERARETGARVTTTEDWRGFGHQKNRALELATTDWVLSLDADERVDATLAAEIRHRLADPDADAYECARRSSFCGAWVNHSGWWPGHVTRLFRRGRARFTTDFVHERVVLDPDARLARLAAPLLHHPFRDLSHVLRKIDFYSSAGAEMQRAAGRRASIGQALAHGVWSFVNTYLFKRGFLDGRTGLLIAVAQAEGTFYRYAKLAMDQRTERSWVDRRH